MPRFIIERNFAEKLEFTKEGVRNKHADAGAQKHEMVTVQFLKHHGSESFAPQEVEPGFTQF